MQLRAGRVKAGRLTWLGLTVAYYVAMLLLQWRASGLVAEVLAVSGWRSLNWSYALFFAGFAVVLQGAIARLFDRGGPTLWRPLMLLCGAALAAGQVWLWYARTGTSAAVDLWLSAVLGLAVVALAARALPQRMLFLWYGVRA